MRLLPSLLFGLIFNLVACSERPVPSFSSSSLPLDKEVLRYGGLSASSSFKGLWVATADNLSGVLGRLDLENGEFEDFILPIASDSILLPDGTEGLFLLSRMGSDSIQVLRGVTADVVQELPLPAFINPQYAFRDLEKRVWVVHLDSNLVDVYSPGLEQKLASIDLGSIKDSFDAYAELSFIGPLTPPSAPEELEENETGEEVSKKETRTIGILAQRLKRKFDGLNWVPEAESALAEIHPQTLKLKKAHLLSLPNPGAFYLLPDHSLQFIGRGDFSPLQTQNAKELFLSLDPLKIQREVNLPAYRILETSLSPEGLLAGIYWDAKNKTSCLVYGPWTLYCEKDEWQGHLFGHVVVVDKVMFVSYLKGGQSELWMVPLPRTQADNTEATSSTSITSIKRLPMNRPIRSLSLGP